MPMRDHFHPPLNKTARWDALHGGWPMMIVIDLNKRLPPQYTAEPNIHLGGFEIDATASELDPAAMPPVIGTGGETAAALATSLAWTVPAPTRAVATDRPETDEYEVRVYDDFRRLVAAVEIVSPSNKDRAKHRLAFAAKCVSLYQKGVAVSIIDLVTERSENLYAQVLDMLGQSEPALEPTPPSIYATTFRWRELGARRASRFESWAYPLAVGQPLPTLPLWLDVDLAVPLELESTYEETCRTLRII